MKTKSNVKAGIQRLAL